MVQLAVITGVDSLGRSVEYDNLITVGRDAATVLTPEGVNQAINGSDFLRRLLAFKSVKPEGLVKSPEQQQQEQQSAQQQSMMDKVAAPLAGEAAKAGFGAMAEQSSSSQQQ